MYRLSIITIIKVHNKHNIDSYETDIHLGACESKCFANFSNSWNVNLQKDCYVSLQNLVCVNRGGGSQDLGIHPFSFTEKSSSQNSVIRTWW